MPAFACKKCCDLCSCEDCKACFPAEAQILLDTDETIQVKDLRAGDRVLTGKLLSEFRAEHRNITRKSDLRAGHGVLTGKFNQNLEQNIEI